MKKLENKSTKILLTEESEVPATYAELLFIVMNRQIPEGLTVKEMARDIEIVKKLQSAETEIEFSEEEHAFVLECFENAKFPIRHIDIIELYNDLKSC